MRTWLLVVAAMCSLGSRAGADSTRAWAAARASLPADTRTVVGVDVDQLRATRLFTTYLPQLRAALGAPALDAALIRCKIDLQKAVRGVVVAATDAAQGAYLAVAGIAPARLTACLVETAKTAEAGAAWSARRDGDLTRLTSGDDSFYLGWIGNDVLVVARTGELATARRWFDGKGAFARSRVAGFIAKSSTRAAVWGASDSDEELQPGLPARGYGTIKIANRHLAVELHGTTASAAQAATAADGIHAQLIEARATPLLPGSLFALVNAVTVTAVRDEVIIKADVREQDLIAAIDLALNGLGGFR